MLNNMVSDELRSNSASEQSSFSKLVNCPLAPEEYQLINQWKAGQKGRSGHYCFIVDNDGEKERLPIKTHTECGTKQEQSELVKSSLCHMTGVKDLMPEE